MDGSGSATLTMVGLVVKDIERSLGFYERLGLRVPSSDGTSHVEIPTGSDVVLFVDSAPQRWDPVYDQADPRDTYDSLLEFFLPTEQELREVFENVSTLPSCRGIRRPYATTFGMCFAFVQDPDGHTILLSAPLASGGGA